MDNHLEMPLYEIARACVRSSEAELLVRSDSAATKQTQNKGPGLKRVKCLKKGGNRSGGPGLLRCMRLAHTNDNAEARQLHPETRDSTLF